MTASVVEQVHVQSAGGAGANVVMATTPTGGQVVYVALLSSRSTPRTVSAISGLGATWTEVHNSGTSRYIVYKGTGATTAGTVTITLSGTQTTTTSLWLLPSGMATTIVASFTTAASATTLAGPSQSAGNGQVVLASEIVTGGSTTFPSSQTPSSSYTASTGSASGTAYATPASTASHQVSASTPSAASLWIGQSVIGDITASIPEVNAALAGSGVLSAAVVEVEQAAASLTGSGALSAAVVPVESRAAVLAGSGVLAASVVAVIAVTASLTGSGALTGESSVAASASLSGTGTLSAVVEIAELGEVDGNLTGSGDLSASVVPVHVAAASLSGSGVLSASVVPVQAVAADLAGSGVLTADVLPSVAIAADLSGSGSLTADVEAVESDWFPIDLSTMVNLWASATWTGSRITADTPGGMGSFTFPREFDPAITYDVEVDYDVTSGSSGDFYIWSIGAPTQEGADASDFYAINSVTSIPAGTGTLAFTVGPGVNQWDAAMVAGETYPQFDIDDDFEILAIRTNPALLVDFVEPPVVVGSAVTRTGGRSRSGVAVVSWTPAVVPPPTVMVSGAHRRIRAAAYGAVTMVGTQPTFTVSSATASRTRTRILVGGKDISFFRGVPTPEPGYQLAEPLLWGPTSIELPQVSACFETAGLGDLTWCAKGKPVKFERVTDDGTIVAVDYRGIVVAHDISGRNLRLEVGGHGQGRASLRYKPSPIFRDTLDLGRLAWAAIRDMGLQFEPRLGPTTGMKSALLGGMTHLDYIAELCAKAWQRNGTQWTLMPDDDATYTFAPKDVETVDFTVFTDDAHSVPDLRSDAAEEPNRIFASGVTPKGQRVRFGVYPGLEPGPAAPYPFDDDSSFDVGTTDADTDTGDGITVMVRRLWTAGYLSLEEADGTYDADVANALAALQTDAGLTGPVGVMTPALWRALFDLDTTGYTLRGSRVEPAAQANKVRRYKRSASGAVIGKNPTFDPSALVVDRAIDFGSGFSRHQMREWSRAEKDRGEDNWVGTISLNTGAVLVGDVAAGDTITAADLMDVRAIKPGMNGRIHFGGQALLMHVAVVDVDTQDGAVTTARLTVDTQARDALAVWEVIRRNKETRRDPARRWHGNRASGQVKDSITEWDEIGGVIAGDRGLVAGWNVIGVVAGQEGTVSRIRTVVQSGSGAEIIGHEHAICVTGKSITAARLNHLNPDPLSIEGTKAWETAAVRTVLDAKRQVYSAGTVTEPCGYGAGRKGDDDTLTGLHVDDAGFSYRTDTDPLLYLAIYVAAPATLLGGRVMWNQLEAGA